MHDERNDAARYAWAIVADAIAEARATPGLTPKDQEQLGRAHHAASAAAGQVKYRPDMSTVTVDDLRGIVDDDCPDDHSPIDVLPVSDETRAFLKSRGIDEIHDLERYYLRYGQVDRLDGIGPRRAQEIKEAHALYVSASGREFLTVDEERRREHAARQEEREEHMRRRMDDWRRRRAEREAATHRAIDEANKPGGVGNLPLSLGTFRALVAAGVLRVEQLVGMDDAALLALDRIGEKRVREVRETMERRGGAKEVR